MRIYVNPMFLRLLVCHAIPPKTKFPLSHLMIKRRSALCVMFRLVKNEIENLSRHKKEKKKYLFCSRFASFFHFNAFKFYQNTLTLIAFTNIPYF